MKETISKVKRQPSEWKNRKRNWQRISKIYEQFMQLNTRKINDPIIKWAKELNRHFSKEDRWLTNTGRDAQHHSLSEKCKSKPQRSLISCRSKWLPSKSTNNKCWRGCREKGTLLHCWWECKLAQPPWRRVWRFLEKLKIDLPMTQQSHSWAYTQRKP